MAATEIKVQMQQRRDTASGWTSANPRLLSGELGYETDTDKWKVGDGSTSWSALGYTGVGGATGGGDDQWALEHDNTITTTYTISTGKNVISAGPISIDAAATITVPATSFWVIV